MSAIKAKLNLNDLESYFEENRITINGDGVSDRTFFVKIRPSGVHLIKPYIFSRDIDRSFVSKMIEEQEQIFQSSEAYSFFNPVHICRSAPTDNIFADKGTPLYEIIDGQHILETFCGLKNSSDRPMLPAIIHYVNSEEEKTKLFSLINKRVNIE